MNDLSFFYNGFKIDKDVGNNAFSFSERQNKAIYVAPLIIGSLDKLEIAKHISFCEIVDSKEYSLPGLKYFLHWNFLDKDIFIFDNHNHAFFFWAYALQNKIIRFGETLVHIDQHSDMRNPDRFIGKNDLWDLQKVFDYTNFELNVGNFIKPAINIGLFKTVEIIDSSSSLEREISGRFVLDIDMDFFCEDLNYIDNDLKIKVIKKYIKLANFITIATSPFFMDQRKAIDKILELF